VKHALSGAALRQVAPGLAFVCAALAITGRLCDAQAAPLAVEERGAWRGLWRPDSMPPLRWSSGDATLLAALQWKAGRAGVTFAEIPLRGDGEAWRTRAIIVRIDPSRVRLTLDTSFRARRALDGAAVRTARWRIADASPAAVLAVNAGQFAETLHGTLPWGWAVLNGQEWRVPGVGPLSTGVAIDSGGRVRLMSPAELSGASRTRGVAWAFQSFPTLLEGDGSVPAALRDTTSGVDLTHRDARLGIGVLRDGTVVIAMTRFDAFGPTLGAVPFGLTTPEMAAFMGALGCTRAVMLDGGISAQMQLRDAGGSLQRWVGWRRVPMGLLALPR
jgi:uncharacterized protein YigE (DUF2233 family)